MDIPVFSTEILIFSGQRFGRMIFVGTLCSCPDCDAVVWTDQVMQWVRQSLGVLWVHDWDILSVWAKWGLPFGISRDGSRGVCSCSMSVLTHAHTLTHTASPVPQYMLLVHFVLQSMLNMFGVCRKCSGCRGNIWTVETIREHVHIYQHTLKTLICFLPCFLFKWLKTELRESPRSCARG